MMETIDMIGNINDLMNLVYQMRNNPVQVLSKRFDLPQGVDTSDPNNIIQHLLNTGQVSQQQVNWAMSMRNNPMIQQIVGGSRSGRN